MRAPRSQGAAARMLERFAELEGELAAIETERNRVLAQVNGEADAEAAPLLAERDAIRAKLAAWWSEAGPQLTEGKRKSIELGGCIIGSRSGRAVLDVASDEGAVAAVLAKRPWATALIRVKTTLDKGAVLKALEGAYKKQLRALGLTRRPAEELFFVEAVQQPGTLA